MGRAPERERGLPIEVGLVDLVGPERFDDGGEGDRQFEACEGRTDAMVYPVSERDRCRKVPVLSQWLRSYGGQRVAPPVMRGDGSEYVTIFEVNAEL